MTIRQKVYIVAKRHRFQGRPDTGSRSKKRCGAKLHGKLAWCRRWPVKGKKRCRLHGGMSTGAKTPEGKARVLIALTEGRRRWIEQMKAEGKKFPWGRKAGYRWTTPGMRERAAAENQARGGSPNACEERLTSAIRREADADPAANHLARCNGRISLDDLVRRAKARIAEMRANLEAR